MMMILKLKYVHLTHFSIIQLLMQMISNGLPSQFDIIAYSKDSK